MFYQLFSYGMLWWLVFVGIAYSVARYTRWWCIPIGHLAVATIIYFLDVAWIRSEMSRPDWNGVPDMDIVFAIGMFTRIILVNLVLLPVTVTGIWLRRRHHNYHAPSIA